MKKIMKPARLNHSGVKKVKFSGGRQNENTNQDSQKKKQRKICHTAKSTTKKGVRSKPHAENLAFSHQKAATLCEDPVAGFRRRQLATDCEAVRAKPTAETTKIAILPCASSMGTGIDRRASPRQIF